MIDTLESVLSNKYGVDSGVIPIIIIDGTPNILLTYLIVCITRILSPTVYHLFTIENNIIHHLTP